MNSQDFRDAIGVANVYSVAVFLFSGFVFFIYDIQILHSKETEFFIIFGVLAVFSYISVLIFAIKKHARMVPTTQQDKIDMGFLVPIGEIVRGIGMENVCCICNKNIILGEILVKHFDNDGTYYNHFICDPKKKKITKWYHDPEKRKEYPELDLLKEILE